METRRLIAGNEALAEAAIQAGCECFFGYPITPATEILEYMAARLPEVNGLFLQPESELSSINMLFGAAAAGKRAMTASSSTAISLMQEGISVLAAAELPGVIVNIMRSGPGLGYVSPAQSDYAQATKGGGHGDYRLIVLAPASVQEMVDLTILAFDLADHYRNPAMILADGMLGQMAEAIRWPTITPHVPDKDWATTGAAGRPRNLILAAPLNAAGLIALNQKLAAKYALIASREQRWQTYETDNAELVVVAFGTAARVALRAVEDLRAEGIPVGLFRPVTLWPFPEQGLAQLGRPRAVLVVEMNNGQMVDDVRLAVNGRAPVRFYGQGGGWVPNPDTVRQVVDELWREVRP